jgi:hypothetical protein
LFSPIVARFRYPIDATDIAINLAPPAPFTMSAEDDILRIFPDPYWPSSTRLNISVGPATRAPVEQQFTSTSWAFDTTAIREEAEHYDAVREQEAAQKTEEDLAEEQAKGDLLFVEQITRATENNPKMRVVNMLPLDMGRYKISYRLERDTFVIAYEAVADQQAALQWFEQQGYTPTQIEWIPLDLPPHGFGTP